MIDDPITQAADAITRVENLLVDSLMLTAFLKGSTPAEALIEMLRELDEHWPGTSDQLEHMVAIRLGYE